MYTLVHGRLHALSLRIYTLKNSQTLGILRVFGPSQYQLRFSRGSFPQGPFDRLRWNKIDI